MKKDKALLNLLLNVYEGRGFDTARPATYGRAIKAGLITFGGGMVLQWRLTDAGKKVLSGR